LWRTDFSNIQIVNNLISNGDIAARSTIFVVRINGGDGYESRKSHSTFENSGA